MKYSITKEHRDYFQKNQFVEFAEFLTARQCEQLNQAIDQVLAQRLSLSGREVKKQLAEKLFFAGHDLWRADPGIRKIVLQPSFAKIACQLTEQKELRIGYDQLLNSTSPSDTPYPQLLQGSHSLEQISSIQPILCGLLICLESNLQESSLLSFVPVVPGHAIFIGPKVIFDFKRLLEKGERRYLLIVYASRNAIYQPASGDLHAHFLKNLELPIGANLSDKLNPIVYT